MRRAAVAGVASVALLGLPACTVAYLPSERGVADRSGAGELTRLVSARPQECGVREARGTLRNRSDRDLEVRLAVTWRGPGTEQTHAELAIAAPAGKTVSWQAPAPSGTSAEGGCSAGVKAATAAR